MPNFVEIIDEHESFTVQIGDSSFTLRRMTTEAAEEIAQRHRVRRKDNTGRTYFEVPPERMLEYLRDLYDYIILSWSGVIHPVTQQAVPCDAAHKLKLPQKVRDRLVELADAEHISEAAVDPTNGSAKPSGGN